MNRSIKLLLTISAIAFYLLSNAGCKTIGNDCDTWAQEPGSAIFIVLESSGELISDEMINNYSLFCQVGELTFETYTHFIKEVDPSVKMYPNDSVATYFLKNFSDTYDDFSEKYDGLNLLSEWTRFASGKYETHYFYLKNNISEVVDTIHLKTQFVNNCQALEESCLCRTPIRTFMLNGEDLSPDDELTKYYNVGYPVYRLRVK